MGDRVRKPVEEILTEDKPILQRVEAVEVEADDILIGCAGFEDRAAEVILKRLSSNVRRAVVVDYRPAILSNRLEEVTSQCQKRGIPHQVLRVRPPRSRRIWRGSDHGVSRMYWPNPRGRLRYVKAANRSKSGGARGCARIVFKSHSSILRSCRVSAQSDCC